MANKKKKRPAAGGGSPSQGQRIADLEKRVATLEQSMTSVAQFVAYGVAQQVQEHLVAHPEDRARLEAAAANGPAAAPASPFLASPAPH